MFIKNFMPEQLIYSVQKQLIELTNIKFSIKYIETYIYPIFEYIISSKKKKFLIAGSQGIGKSTLLYILEKNLKDIYNKQILSLSLDDYYLTKKQRVSLSKKIHPLLLTRGVPGTHDTKKLLKHVKCFERSNYPINIPIFDKINDDRSTKLKKIKSKADILILEGWCCASPALSPSFLKKNINQIEKMLDKDLIWRNYYNHQLENQYAKLFKLFDKVIYLKAPSFSHIQNWRLKQEKMMVTRNNDFGAMDKNQIFEFIQHYEKITKWMMQVLPSKANLTINVDKNQKIKKILFKKITID